MSKTVILKWNSASPLKVCSSEFESGWGVGAWAPIKFRLWIQTWKQQQMVFNPLENIMYNSRLIKNRDSRKNSKDSCSHALCTDSLNVCHAGAETWSRLLSGRNTVLSRGAQLAEGTCSAVPNPR